MAVANVRRLDAVRPQRQSQSKVEREEESTMGQSPSNDSVRLIKRYANRKLYDTVESRYVTLQQIAEFIREGQDVRIVDNRSKEDLTNVTLAQIIYEEEKSGDSQERRSSLLTFIQTGRERLITSLPKFPSFRREAEGDEGERSEKRKLDLKAVADEQVRGFLDLAMHHMQQLQGEVKRLQGRIEELEGRISQMVRGDSSSKPDDPS